MQRGLGGFPHERLHQDKACRRTKNPRSYRAGSVNRSLVISRVILNLLPSIIISVILVIMLGVILGKVAGVAQLVEQLICNQLAAGSNPVTSL